MSNSILKKYALERRKKFIYSLKYKDLPVDIRTYLKKNRKLTKAERYMSAFLQSMVRYGYIKKYKSQQIVRLGPDGKYIMPDFMLTDPDVIIEVDGPEHWKAKDEYRDMEVQGLFEMDTIRVTNADMIKENKDTRTRLIKEICMCQFISEDDADVRVKEYWQKQELGE